jgi:NADH-quinone oxidoreductase subunit N
MWVIDVYGGSCYSFLSYLAVIPKISLFMLLLKLYFMYFIDILSDMNFILIYCSIISVFIGTVGALLQTSVKRLLAYSAVSHVGYIILGFVTGSFEGLIGVIFYVFVYVLIMLSIFGVFMVSRDSIGNRLIHNLSSVNSLYEGNKIIGLVLLLGLFSVAGIPPLIGFFSKLYIYFGLLTEGFYMFLLSIILMSVVGVVYYIRLIRVLFFTENKRYVLYSEINTASLFILSILSLCGVYFIFYSKFIIITLNNLVLLFMI